MRRKILELLFDYKKDCRDESEKKFNNAMIGSILSTARAFSIERDKLCGEWEVIDSIKKRRESLINVLKGISPLEKNNYWIKIFSLLTSM